MLEFEMIVDPKCHDRLIGLWAIEPVWFTARIQAIKQGAFPVAAAAGDGAGADNLYTVRKGGIAQIDIAGPMQKGPSKFGGTDTVATRKAIRQAAMDKDVKGIMLHIDSPGGTVAGTADLAADVRMANGRKPVYGHVDDLGASAAMWVATQTRKLSASKSSEIGSFGTMAEIVDSSAAAEMSGFKVHIISTGDMKGAFAEGTPVTSEQIDYLQSRVNALNELFVEAVAGGRGMAIAGARELFSGRVWMASEARDKGVLDSVTSFDAALSSMRADLAAMDQMKRAEQDDKLRRSRMM